MTEEKFAVLLKRLHDRTAAGKVKWEETTRKNFYQCAFPDYTIQIGPGDDNEPVLKIINADNVLMEQISGYQLQRHDAYAISTMQELYIAAKRTALNTEKALDDILSSLGENGD